MERFQRNYTEFPCSRNLKSYMQPICSVLCSEHLAICPYKIANKVIHTTEYSFQYYVVGSKRFWTDIQKPHQMENAVRDI